MKEVLPGIEWVSKTGGEVVCFLIVHEPTGVRFFAGGGEAELWKRQTTMEHLPQGRVMPPRELVACWREMVPLPRQRTGSVTWSAVPAACFRRSHS